jgi:hypothetical protein
MGERDSFYEKPIELLDTFKTKIGQGFNEIKLFKTDHSFIGVEQGLVVRINSWINKIRNI